MNTKDADRTRAVIDINDIGVSIKIGCDIDIDTERDIHIVRHFLQKLKIVTNSQPEAL